ncbi:mycothiol synthase [Skermania sp. ID1734]|uniref:mycothiol synthase n=1 Tax=Skermania sp. ID1734 TaxID=2597516 RepID=UPI00117FC11A|nr:mycothiol synthase [Skermania sp. ID1734]TSD96561.1 mycothiol synthase [Skermania sp. ID1734]
MTWHAEVGPAQARHIIDLVDAATVADGTAPISEQAVASLAAGSAARHLIWDFDGQLAGYANLVPGRDEHPPMAEVVVAPAQRNHGIGTKLVDAALAAGGPGARVWAHGNLPAAQAVARRLELEPVRQLLQSRRAMATALPEVEVPAGVSVRTYAGPDDDAEILRVNNAAFAWHPEQGGWTEQEVASRRASDWFDPAGLFLATDEHGKLLGFHWTKIHRTAEPAVGEVYVVAVDPGAQGRGLGRLLTLVGLQYLHEHGLPAVMLYVEADNVAAVRTYRALGFETFHTDVAYARRTNPA